MKFETIRVDVQDGLVRLTLAGETITVRMIEELQSVGHWIEDESGARAVILRGAGPSFCRGIDFSDFPIGEKPNVYGFSKWEKALRAFERLPMVTIAAIDGECRGGGVHLALVCDARVATSRSFFHLHEVPDGFLPGMATFRLAKFIGLGRARRMALSGRRVDAAEAERIGLVDRICADDALDQTVREALDEFRAMPPDAVELAKRLLNESFAASYEDFVGGFLAAQHRAVQTDTFAAQLGKTNPSKSKD